MNSVRAASLILLLTASLWGCGGKSHRPAHASPAAAAEPAPPTPDTTPIEALRTPAGLALKIETQPPGGSTPGPAGEAGEVTPVPSPPK